LIALKKRSLEMSKRDTILYVIGGTSSLLALFFLCLGVGLYMNSKGLLQREPTQVAQQLIEERATRTPRSTRVPKPTATLIPAPTKEPLPNNVREDNGVFLTLIDIRTVSQLNNYTKAPEGGMFVAAEVLIENKRSSEVSYNMIYFTLKDKAGHEYTPTIFTSDNEAVLVAGDLMPQEKVRGWIAFRVPVDFEIDLLRYDPLVIYGDYDPMIFQWK